MSIDVVKGRWLSGGCLVSQGGHVVALLGWGMNYPHLPPVIRKFFAAIQAGHIGTRQLHRRIRREAGRTEIGKL